MSDPDSPTARAEATAVAEQVHAGTDAIVVPDDLVREPAEPQETPHAEQALWLRIRSMSVAEKVKLALRGNKDARGLLLRDTNRVIPRLVLQNPRITEEEILTLAKDRNADEELLRLIAENREWTKIYAVRHALVENARCPSGRALQLLPSLSERDISRLAKSKQVPNVISMQARRIMFQQMQRRH
jgi:hypothetical protein